MDQQRVGVVANKLSGSLNASVFVYSGDIDDEGFGYLLKNLRTSAEQPHKPNAILFLTTYGGSVDAAFRIARMFQSITREFYVCVPYACKSAGTLVALGANRVYMFPLGELGPLDVQLRRPNEIDNRRRSGMVVRTALEGLADEAYKLYMGIVRGITSSSKHRIGFEAASRVASEIATGAMATVYAQISPEALGNDLRDLSVAKAYGDKLVEYSQNAKEGAVRRLVEEYPAHEFIIDREEARNLLNHVPDPTEEMFELLSVFGDIVYRPQDPHFVMRVDTS